MRGHPEDRPDHGSDDEGGVDASEGSASPNPPDEPDPVTGGPVMPDDLSPSPDPADAATADQESRTETEAESGAPSRSIARAFAGNIVTSGGTIVAVFFTGVITARLLSTDGRGEVSAIAAWILTVTWASSLGFPRAMAYYVAKGKDAPPLVLTTTLASIIPLGIFGITVAQLLLPLGFSAQSADTQHLARLMFLGLPAFVAGEAIGALLAGLHLFRFLNIVRLAQPLLYLATLLVLWATDLVMPWTVLFSQMSSYLVVSLVAVGYLVHLYRPRPRLDLDLIRRGLSYGIRQQGVALGELVTARLDLMMLPAYVAVASVGYYSIAVNITSMVMSVFGSLSIVVFPMAARGHEQGDLSAVYRGVRLTVYGGAACVIVLAVISPALISIVYGDAYLGALPSLWLLLPGVVVWSAAGILASGLQAVGKPGRASMTQFVGVIVTVAGLLWALPLFGIEGAAAVSTTAYTCTFIVVTFILARQPAFSVGECFSPRAAAADVSVIVRRVRERLAARKAAA